MTDWPGTGRSGNRNGLEIDYAAVVDGYRTLLRDVIAEPVVVVCHSMGGAVTWQLVEHESDLVAGVLSVAGAYPANVAPRSQVVSDDGAVAVVDFADTGVRMTVDRRVMNLYGDGYVFQQGIATSTRFPMEQVDAMRAGFVGLPPRMLLQRLGVEPGMPTIDSGAGFAGKPIRLLASAEDPAHTRAIEERTLGLLRGWGAEAELVWLPELGIEGNGHFMMFEDNSDELLEVVADSARGGRGGGAMRYGSDAIVSHLVEAGIEQVAFNPGASFRGIHDSLVHTPGAPAISLCMHEMVAVSMAQGYAKAAGKPMAALLHNVVGLQNASMAIYNAWCDRVPMLLLGGTGPKSKANRRPWIDWIHTASVQANIVRDFVKWDDEPHDMASVAESFARGLTATRALPSGPVYLCYDVDLQEDPLPAEYVEESIAQYAIPSPPAPAPADVDWLVEQLRAAERPLILAGYVGESPAQFAALTALAEALGAPVVDTGVRHAFPSGHRLNGAAVPGLVEEADVILALDVEELHGPPRRAAPGRPGTLTLLNVTLSTLKLRAWAHDYQPLAPASGRSRPPRTSSLRRCCSA